MKDTSVHELAVAAESFRQALANCRCHDVKVVLRSSADFFVLGSLLERHYRLIMTGDAVAAPTGVIQLSGLSIYDPERTVDIDKLLPKL